MPGLTRTMAQLGTTMRTPSRLLVLSSAAFLLLGACSRFMGGGSGSTTYTVAPSVDSTLRVAATQLRHHGYTVTPVGSNSLVTAPRAVPDYLAGKDASLRGRRWFVQVTAERNAFIRGTRLDVVGYLIPQGAPTTGTTPSVQRAERVDSKQPLHQEVRSIAGWIADAANRKRR